MGKAQETTNSIQYWFEITQTLVARNSFDFFLNCIVMGMYFLGVLPESIGHT